MSATRNVRRHMTGVVTSDRMTKTITVQVERTYKHPKYGKYIRARKRYHAHDEKEQAHVGDRVEIVATRPLSKIKRWSLKQVVEAAHESLRDESTAGG